MSETWPFGTDAAAELVAAVAWPNENAAERNDWARRLASDPDLRETTIRRARERFEQAVAAIGGEGVEHNAQTCPDWPVCKMSAQTQRQTIGPRAADAVAQRHDNNDADMTWIDWLAKTAYGIDWRCRVDPPVDLDVYAARWEATDPMAEEIAWCIEEETGPWKRFGPDDAAPGSHR